MASLPLVAPNDQNIWKLWFSKYWFMTLGAAHDAGLFGALKETPKSAEQLSRDHGLNRFTLRPVIAILSSLGFLKVIDGLVHLTEDARTFLLKDSPFHWGAPLAHEVRHFPLHQELVEKLQNQALLPHSPSIAAEGWEAGEIDAELARDIAAYMQAQALPASIGVALRGDFAGVTRLLDVGGGSGCYSISIAQHQPHLRCTVMDLASMCGVATEYIRAAGMTDRVDTVAVDMFRERWPPGSDAIFMSNVFHDWNFDTCAELAEKAFQALPSGGRLYLHEMLFDDDGEGPLETACFSLVMLLGTMGQQFTGPELAGIVQKAGFQDVTIAATHSLYSLLCARKP